MTSFDPRPSGLAHCLTKRGLVEQPCDRRFKRTDVFRRDEYSGLAGYECLLGSGTNICGNYRETRSLSLKKGYSKSFSSIR